MTKLFCAILPCLRLKQNKLRKRLRYAQRGIIVTSRQRKQGNEMSAQIGTVSNFEINGDKLLAHGYEWAIKSVREYDHWGATRLMIKATKAKGRKIFNMVVYENNTISGAV